MNALFGTAHHPATKRYAQLFEPLARAMMSFLGRMRKRLPDVAPSELLLPRDALIEIPLLGNGRITCASGSVWITRDHDAADYLLGPGESFSAPDSRRVLVESLREARVRIDTPAAAPGAKACSGRGTSAACPTAG